MVRRIDQHSRRRSGGRRPGGGKAAGRARRPRASAEGLGLGLTWTGKVRRVSVLLLPAAASALMLFAAYPLPDVGWLAWVALVPWTVQVLRARSGRVALQTWPVWLVWWLVMLHWLRFATVTGWLALVVYMSAYFPVAALLLRTLRSRLRVPATLSLPVVWVGLEFLRARLLTGFPWFFLGHTQHASLSLVQVADLAGVAGLTFVVGAVNGLVVDLLIEPVFRPRAGGGRPRLRRGALASAAFVALLVAGSLIYGRWRLAQGRRTIGRGPRVAAVQGNIPQEVKRSGSIDDEVATLKEHLTLTRKVVGQPLDLIVWPETMVPGHINREYLEYRPEGPRGEAERRYIAFSRMYRNEVETLAAEAGAPMLVGNVTVRFDAAGRRRQFNTALLITPDGATAARYDKMHLVPFGEYLPLQRYLPWLRRLTPYDYDYTLQAGEEPTVFRVGRWRFAVAICFESTIPRVVRRLAWSAEEGKRADFLLNISNDGWFRASSELPQHLAINVFRAVENRVGIVRAVNTGISALIDPDGRVIKVLERDGRRRGVAGVLVGEVGVDGRVTLFARWGDWLGGGLAGLLALGCGASGALWLRGRRGGKKKQARRDFT